MPKLKHVCKVGKTYGRLKVLALLPGSPYPKVRVQCKCARKTIKEIQRRAVASGHTISCGCAQREAAAKIGEQRATGNAAIHWLYGRYRLSARKKQQSFALSLEQFSVLVRLSCHYCGAAPARQTPDAVSKYGLLVYNGIDRKRNTEGYTLENSVACCTRCNFKKGADSDLEFLAWVRQVATHCSEPADQIQVLASKLQV